VLSEPAVLVLAAGRGRRLRPLTDHTAKPLLEVGDLPLLEHALRRISALVTVGPQTVAVNTHWFAAQVSSYLGSRVHVSVEAAQPLGTAGAVGALREWIAGRDVLIANSDAWYQPEPDLVGFAGGWDRQRPRLLVVADDHRPDFNGRWRFAGMSLLPGGLAAALEPVPSGLFEVVWSTRPLDLVPTRVTFIDCGTPAELERARSLAG
jgi:hypothetical protein